MDRDLHFDIEKPPRRILRFDIQHHQFGSLKLLVAERIQNVHFRNRVLQLQNRI